ncbi:hypothetical protein GC097_22790 [Paenibacillus sp. LMG 31457]|uniref:Uncharacterized protein n=2 Tax=Paenibacillus planticolens TaxID=2654976 RepID=A0ABX1ZW05_9BACL|nr:hypothetical protein [Paenibacillus planticolens]
MKFTAYWLFNIVLGIPTPFVLIFMIFGFYGFMAPSSINDKYMAAGSLLVYLLIWLFGNLLILRKEDRATRIGMLALSPLPIAIAAFCSFKIIATVSS